MTDEITSIEGTNPTSPFDSIRKSNRYGVECWSARELQPLLGYRDWRNFRSTIAKARTACRQSGNQPEHHFVGVTKVIHAGQGAKQELDDILLSRFGCYLIAQNGDPSKTEIALAQTYFAIQARRQELSDARDLERLDLRERAAEEFKALSRAAKGAGVQSPHFGIFHDAGYKGMYGGLGRVEIMRKKKIPDSDNLMDRMDTTELAANQFRMTQTREKLTRDEVQDEERAIRTHQEVGREVRAAIRNIGGTMPEDIPAAEPIGAVKKRVRGAKPRLELPEGEARGLLGGIDPR
jgi:DNA-damage-inducible protein D